MLRDRAGETEGSTRIDPGAPHFHSTDPEPKPEPKAEKSDIEKRLDALEAENKTLRARTEELSQSERYWAEQARGRNVAPLPDDDDDTDEGTQPSARPLVTDDKPEKLLDDLSAEGLKALAKRGVITADQLEAALEAQERKFNQRLSEAQDGVAFDQKLGKEFPDLVDPKSDLFKRAQVHFRQMVEVDPAAKKSRSALWAAASMAKKEIEMESAADKKNERQDRETRRRDRIDAQRGERDTGGGRDDDTPTLTNTQREIISRLGITEEQFSRYAEQGTGRNGRGR
ncbi:MAG TPA: hypothetical protein VKX49_26255 [Bryobacteraceae bacterium]|nr:hypothetical protein [Bryobacteraceae bacterium]